ncbi:nucleotide sugar dehydrogenase [Westerdykella ornata]|uniref:UDP-glucose 6-dehydrogenase n=1 Tax=Westerdykella ornata TaxID=318751 RepID=A0A6A6JXN3_WESOR|nr:nucleotide sugar dehydrogenase [Westerdykella ornata]KAF2281380.1 nucleotide sugar dehydrogenase [Westerdykella ornata]
MSTSSTTASNQSTDSLTLSVSACQSPYDTPLTSHPHSPKSTTKDYFPADPTGQTPVNNVCFVGAGFVGGPTAALVAYHNPQIIVNVVDLSEEKVAAWNSRHLPIHENGLPKIVRIARDGTNPSIIDLAALGTVSIPKRAPNLIFSTRVTESIAEADIVFICVNTPTKLYGVGAGATADLSILESATSMIAKYAKDGAIIVEKSTVPCGTANMIRDILEFHRPGAHFEILNNPEFLAEGCAVENLMHPDRILIGSSTTPSGTKAAETLKGVYAAWVPASRILTVNTWSSELTKLVANAMLAQRISSINAVSALCEELGADVEELSLGLGSDSRLGRRFLHAGVGFGGSCFEKDILNLSYMARSLHLDEVADYWMGVLDINKYQRQRFGRKVVRALNGSLRGKKIAILGFAFKENTNDTRNSVAVHLIAELAAEMPAEISVFDPGCSVAGIEEEIRKMGLSDIQLQRIKVREHWRETVDKASAVCILTQWNQFRYPSATAGVKTKAKAVPQTQRVGASDNVGWFFKNKLSEMDIIELEEFVTRDRNDAGEDPLNRFMPESECPLECADCRAKQVGMKEGETVDWAEVATLMREPRWVFDGRSMVDGSQLEKLGFRVRGVGKGLTS